MTAWWDERTPRERGLVGLALASAVAVFAMFAVTAARDDLAGLRDRVAAQERALAHVRGLAADLSRARPGGDGDALLARLETAADAVVGRARIASMTPLDGADIGGAREERVALRLAGASLGETVRLLHALAEADPPLPVVRLALRKHPDDARHFDATIEVSRLVAREGRAMNATVKRWLVRLGVVFALFVFFLMLLFPTADLVRGALTGMLPAGTKIAFTSATLRPWGLRVEGLSLQPPTSQRPVEIPWVRVSPSLLGFLTNGVGRPWRVGAAICLGTLDGSLEKDGQAQVLDASWTDVDVATCLGLVGAPVRVSGRTTGTVDARLLPTGPESGAGEIVLRAASWAPPLPQLEDVILHADTALLRWTLAGPTLTLSEVRASGPELTLAAQGTIHMVARNRGASALRIHVTLTPGPDAPQELTELLDGLPRQGGAYDFTLAGTIDAPRIEGSDD